MGCMETPGYGDRPIAERCRPGCRHLGWVDPGSVRPPSSDRIEVGRPRRPEWVFWAGDVSRRGMTCADMLVPRARPYLRRSTAGSRPAAATDTTRFIVFFGP